MAQQTEIKEQLAEYAHNQWTGWMRYLFSKGEFNEDGTWTMPNWAVERWKRQMNTEYKDLLEEEKDSDRKIAEGMLNILKQIIWHNKQQ